MIELRHLIAYHNPEKMGYRAADIDTSRGFRVFTRKNARGLRHRRVWMFTGEEHPRQYSLIYTFVVDEVARSAHPDFRLEVAGTEGVRFEPSLRIDHTSWFADLRRASANFSLGLHSLQLPQVERELLRLLEEHQR